MGFIERTNAIEAYRRIRRDAISRVCSILILTAPTLDAICGLKILTQLFVSDFLPFKVVPVAGYDDIVAANDNFIQGRNEISTVIMLDCGGMVDLGEFLSLSPEMTVYILDSHRPYNLINIFGNSQLKIIDDGSIAGRLDFLKDAYEGTKVNPKEIESDGEDTDEASYDEDEANLAEGEENADPNLPRDRSPINKKMAKRDLYQKMLAYYQSGSYYGNSIAHLIFGIADQLAKSNNDHLWCAILGVTYQHILELRSEDAYNGDFEDLREACLRANPKTSTSDGVENKDGLIKQEDEFRFMLMRHWTLFNSMFHSKYIATRLNIWRDKGKRRLETFIVKMGIPLHQCVRDYGSMDLEYKESLASRLTKHATDFGIGNILFSSFSRDFGYILKMSASDAVYSLMALVEAPHSEEGTAIGAIHDGEDEKTKEKIWLKNFYAAFDALDFHNTNRLKRGIQLAMKQQQVCLQEATKIITHRLVRTGRHFRYVILRHSPDLAWLSSHPMSLSKLALFLVEAMRLTKKSALPLVLAAFQHQSQLYQVVATNGIQGEERKPNSVSRKSKRRNFGANANGLNEDGIDVDSDEESEEDGYDTPLRFRNHFGMCFRQAAQKIRARVKHDGFQTSVIEVNAEDLKPFLHALQTIPFPVV